MDLQNFIAFSMMFHFYFNQNVQNCNFALSKRIVTGQISLPKFVGIVRIS